MEIAGCGHRSDENHRAISGVLKQSLKNGLLEQDDRTKRYSVPLVPGLQTTSDKAILDTGERSESS